MDVWNQILEGVQKDFGDTPNAEQLTQVVVRIFMAAALGGALGYEREKAGKAAGLRTHMLVALGSAVFVLAPLQAGVSHADLTRVLQGLVTGIGFLGAGAILKQSEDKEIKGLTTAAGIWFTAAVGATAGMGREVTAIVCTVLGLIILRVFPAGRSESA